MTRKRKINKIYNKIKKQSIQKDHEYDKTLEKIKEINKNLDSLYSKYKDAITSKSSKALDDLPITSLKESVDYERFKKLEKSTSSKIKEANDLFFKYEQLKKEKDKLVELSKEQFIDKIKKQIDGFDSYIESSS